MSKKLASVLVRTVIGVLVFLVALVLAAIAIAALAAHGLVDKDQAVFGLMVSIAVVAMVGAMVVSVAWMRSIDEAAREAHKAAWFWGGCSGMSVGVVLVMLSSLTEAEQWRFPSWFDGRTDPAAYAATGAFGMLLIMTLGYTIVWVWWWWRRR